ncbi:MAG: cytochrome C [Blastocatellia bacterium]|nr:MAG: cytochrome C [Blastocatellia bacterium]
MVMRFVLWASVVAVLALAAYLTTSFGGFSTRTEPTAAERLIARIARQLAVPSSSRSAVNPIPFSSEVWAESRAHFADHCATCHANDGSGQTELGQNLYPKAPDMRLAATQDRTDGELYWIIENGVRMTGMPAWGTGGGHDADTWKLVHFIRHLRELSSEQLDEMAAQNPKTRAELEEEQQDEQFLAGKDLPSPTHPGGHVH